jgi:hypothetical protein
VRTSNLIFLLIVMAGYSTASQALTVSPADCTVPNNCVTSNSTGGNDRNVFSPLLDGLDLLYKYETGSAGEDGSATLALSYETTIATESAGDYIGATVTYQGGGDIVDCSFPCYLAVKDGNHQPARYLFDLTMNGLFWNGTDDLVLADFWPGQGSISNFAIYGTASPIPVPATIWLFGTALIGFVGMSRRRKVG